MGFLSDFLGIPELAVERERVSNAHGSDTPVCCETYCALKIGVFREANQQLYEMMDYDFEHGLGPKGEPEFGRFRAPKCRPCKHDTIEEATYTCLKDAVSYPSTPSPQRPSQPPLLPPRFPLPYWPSPRAPRQTLLPPPAPLPQAPLPLLRPSPAPPSSARAAKLKHGADAVDAGLSTTVAVTRAALAAPHPATIGFRSNPNITTSDAMHSVSDTTLTLGVALLGAGVVGSLLLLLGCSFFWRPDGKHRPQDEQAPLDEAPGEEGQGMHVKKGRRRGGHVQLAEHDEEVPVKKRATTPSPSQRLKVAAAAAATKAELIGQGMKKGRRRAGHVQIMNDEETPID